MATAATAPARKTKSRHREINGDTIRSTTFIVSLIALLVGLSIYDYRIALITGGVIGVVLALYGEHHASKPPKEFR